MTKKPKAEDKYEADQDAEDRRVMASMDGDAVLYIRNAADFTEEGKVAVADWLREQAEKLLSDGHNYNFLYTAKYNPED